jgi:hypothetical protein
MKSLFNRMRAAVSLFIGRVLYGLMMALIISAFVGLFVLLYWLDHLRFYA